MSIERRGSDFKPRLSGRGSVGERVKHHSGRPRRGSLGEKPSRSGRTITDSRSLADLERKLGRPEKAGEYGWLAWWKSRDGEFHDYASPTVSASCKRCYCASRISGRSSTGRFAETEAPRTNVRGIPRRGLNGYMLPKSIPVIRFTAAAGRRTCRGLTYRRRRRKSLRCPPRTSSDSALPWAPARVGLLFGVRRRAGRCPS